MICPSCNTRPCCCEIVQTAGTLKAEKDNAGKDRMLILFEYFPHALPMVAEVFYKALELGKYPRNSFADVPVEELLEATLRHIRDHRTGQLVNEKDFGLYHTAHLAANALMALENELADK